jgi:hypothetical protein
LWYVLAVYVLNIFISWNKEGGRGEREANRTRKHTSTSYRIALDKESQEVSADDLIPSTSLI